MTSRHAIPDAALDDRLASVGTSGSGKTYAAGTAVERLLAKKARVVIVDPLDVWYGLRLKQDGVRAAYPVVMITGMRSWMLDTSSLALVVIMQSPQPLLGAGHLTVLPDRRRGEGLASFFSECETTLTS